MEDEHISADSALEFQAENMPNESKKPKSGLRAKVLGQKPRSKKRKVLMVIIPLLILGTAGASYYLLTKGESVKSDKASSDTKVAELPPEKEVAPSTAYSAALLADNTFFAQPKALSNLNFYKNPEEYFGTYSTDGVNYRPQIPSDSIIYRQIGTTKDGRQIIVYKLPSGIDTHWEIALGKDSRYALLEQLNRPTELDVPTYQTDYAAPLKAALSDYVTLDTTTALKELYFDKTATVGGQKLKTDFTVMGGYLENGLASIRGSYFGETTSKPTLLGEVNGRKFYQVSGASHDNYDVMETYAVISDVFSTRYHLDEELMNTTGPLPVSWLSGDNNTSEYVSVGPGCGSYGYVTAKNVDTADLTQVGTTSGGQKVYQLPTSHAFVKDIYDNDYNKGEFIDNASLKNLTIEQFSANHAYFLSTNSLGQQTVFLRGDMIMRGGCGKPVIYLYPTQTQRINVAVAADVVKSEPHYPTNGWQSVLAESSGRLTYLGKTYDSLYWEGYGHGIYPDKTGQGFVVARKDVVSTIRLQLTMQGLNQKEINDFMDFWQPRLPSTPYTRLTWLNTAELNRLAPLDVTPAPRTTIRVFLEFEGLQHPVQLQPQRLVKVPRLGYTLVEWGGLLKDGIK